MAWSGTTGDGDDHDSSSKQKQKKKSLTKSTSSSVVGNTTRPLNTTRKRRRLLHHYGRFPRAPRFVALEVDELEEGGEEEGLRSEEKVLEVGKDKEQEIGTMQNRTTADQTSDEGQSSSYDTGIAQSGLAAGTATATAAAAAAPASNNSSATANSTTTTSTHKAMWFPPSDQIDQSQKALPPPPPNRNAPTSQKAATMAAEPDAEAVEMVMAVVGNVNRATAVRYLKAKHNAVEAAINALLDHEDISKDEEASSWNESLWSNDREGVASEQYLHPLGAVSAAATRPNSPASSLARQNLNPSSKTEEDEDLAKALEMSQSDMRAPTSQETGRIGADGQETRFGPATRKDYDERNWGVVPFAIQDKADEVVPDLDALDRANQPGQPRLLKHLPDGDYVSALLTICHSIHGARETMLMGDHVLGNYGQDADWWRGHPVHVPTVVHVQDTSDSEHDSAEELIAEVQRLMAFLGSSERSYASVSALMQTTPIKGTPATNMRSKTVLELFIQRWIAAAATLASTTNTDRPVSFRNLFTTTVGTTASEAMDTPEMNIVDLPVCIREGEKADLIGRLDDLLWDTDANTSDEDLFGSDNFIVRPASLVVMHVYQQNAGESQLRLDVPPSFYIDKYLPGNVEATRSTRRNMIRGKKRIALIEEIERKLKNWKHPRSNSTLDARQLLSHSLGHYDGSNRSALLAAENKSGSPAVEEDSSYSPPPHYPEIAQKLQNIITAIDSKLATLAEEKEKTRQALAEMSRAAPPGLKTEDLKHRYTLRGVSTKPNITYLLAPKDPPTSSTTEPLISIEEDVPEDEDADSSTPKGMQWWRMEYEPHPSGTAKITKTPTADYDVLRAVELEHKAALLIYANDEIQVPPSTSPSLPTSLATFIETDNALFRTELAHERQTKASSRPTSPTLPSYTIDMTDLPPASMSEIEQIDDIRPSIELENITSRRGSMDSTRVEDGDSRSPTPLDERFGDFGQEMRMSGGGGNGGMGRGTTPVHEIVLPAEEDEGVEMVERGIGGFGSGGGGGGDGFAEGQDAGLGGDVLMSSSAAKNRPR